jgi:nucleoside-diphosphate-sugar epimerase
MHFQQRILVTGGSGFLGPHLCERLLAEGANVICLDNYFYPRAPVRDPGRTRGQAEDFSQ